MVNNGKMYSLPSGQRVWIDEQINPVKFLTKEEFDKQSRGMMSKFLVHMCCQDKISNHKVDLYFIKSKNNLV